MENGPEKFISPRGILRSKILTGQISPTDFLAKIRDFDQMQSDRGDSSQNIKLLTDTEVQEIFMGSEHEVVYSAELSQAYFHSGQIYEMSGGEGLTFFKNALTASKRADDEVWTNYCAATVAYLESNQLELNKLAQTQTGNEVLVCTSVLLLKD